jgi:hypothetical protein
LRAKPGETVATSFEAKLAKTVAIGFEAKPVKTVRVVLRPNQETRVMRASLPLYHLPLMTLLVVLIFSINPMIYVLDQLQEHVPCYWNNM